MSWSEATDDRDTLSELRNLPSRPPGSSSRGRSSKLSASAMGGSKSERRLLMEAKATISAAIAEEKRERRIAKRRARKCVSFLYYTFKVVGVVACVYTSGLNVTLVYMCLDLKLQDRVTRCYLVLFGIGGVLAELDTPFAKANFRAMQKWWFKAPFYVFMAWLCLDARHARGTTWFPLELASFVALQSMAAMSIVLNVCLRQVLERSGALGKRKKLRQRGGSMSQATSRRGREGGTRGRGPGGARVTSSASGGLGVSSFRERDRRRPRPPPSTGVTSTTGSVQSVGSGQGFGEKYSPEMVPEKSGRLISPRERSSSYGGGGGKHEYENYGSTGNGGRGDGAAGAGGGRGFGGGKMAGKIKWWAEGDEDRSPSVQEEGELPVSPASPMSVSTARSSGRTNWWEDSDGEDGSSSMASFSMRDDASEVGSVASGFSSVSTGQAGGRYGSSTAYHGRGTAPRRRSASVSSRRSTSRSARGGLEQRPPPLMTTHHGGFGSGSGAPGGSAGGRDQHVALTAQALARNSGEAHHGTGRGFEYAGVGSGSNYAGSAHGGSSVASSAAGGFGGGGSVRSFGAGRTARRPAWEGGGLHRAASVSGDARRAGGSGASWAQGGSDYDAGRAGSEAAGDEEKTEDGRFSRVAGNANSWRTPGIVDLSPF